MMRLYSIHERLGPYRVFAQIHGGMSVVYGVEDGETGKRFAAKTPRGDGGGQGDLPLLFDREVELGFSLGEHPNVLLPQFVREIEGSPFVFSDYVSGGTIGSTLADWIGEESLKLADVLSFAYQLALGLEHISRQGTVAHLDVKPGNVLVGQDRVLRVADFGLARRMNPFVTGPQREVRGTRRYEAPEHLAKAVVDERADVFSFGLILYELLTEEVPFDVSERGSGGRYADPRVQQELASGLYWRGEFRHPLSNPAWQGAPEMGPLGRIVGGALAMEASERFPDFESLRRGMDALFPSLQARYRGDASEGPSSERRFEHVRYLQMRNKHGPALKELNRLLRARPDDVEMLRAAAASLEAIGRTEEARGMMERAGDG
jgi:serine/threonine protein kinase